MEINIEESKKQLDNLKNDVDKINESIRQELYRLLYSVFELEDYADISDLKKQFILSLNISNDEFNFDYPFGNIDYLTIKKMDSVFQKEGYILYCIISLDIYVNKKGLSFLFKKSE